MPEIHEWPAYGVLVLADWPDATRPAWVDEQVGWVRIDTEPTMNGGHLPRVSWDQPTPLSWAPIVQRSGNYTVANEDRGVVVHAKAMIELANDPMLQKALDPERESVGDSAMAAVRDIAGKR